MVQLVCLESKQKLFSTLCFIFSLIFIFRSSIIIILSVCYGKLAIRYPIPGFRILVLDPNSVSIPITDIQVKFFNKFMKMYIDKVQIPTAAPTKARDNANKLFKSQNLNLYYNNLYIECYYFCWQYKNHFEIVGILDSKHVPFTVKFQKNYIID